MDKINLILDWAEDKQWFDTTFVEKLSDYIERHGELSDAQESALDNIIDKFKIK